MANTDNTITMIAGGTITEFALVSLDTAGKCVVTSASDDVKVIGVAQRAVSAGEAVDVVVSGITRAIAGGSITFATNPLLMATTAGKVIAHGTSGNYSACRVIPNINQTSAASGDQISIFFTGPQNKLP
tara:strand:+ start:145 stop:531 length:387 start_codon:yes stop_codon:yes gene_type:complete